MSTVAHGLVERLRGLAVPGDGKVAPAAILWTDPSGTFAPMVRVAQGLAPELLVFGSFAPDARSGPAIWLRCVVDRTIAVAGLDPQRVPILYLPSIARQRLRAGDDCPAAWRPLVELLYRGTSWVQPNGADWTPAAFLGSAKGLGLDLAGDRATTDALLRALAEVARTPVARLSGRRLDAGDFDGLLSEDPSRDLLRWIANPAEAKAGSKERFGAFVEQCKCAFGIDPTRDPPTLAAERLCLGSGRFEEVWRRFVEAPAAYPGLVGILERIRPKDGLFAEASRWAFIDAAEEDSLRLNLESLRHQPQRRTCDAVLSLEEKHGPRRASVWAKLGRSPLAVILEPLARLAAAARVPLAGATPEECAKAYEERGWLADAAACDALAAVEPGQSKLVSELVHALLGEWLDAAARNFQRAMAAKSLSAAPESERTGRVEVDPGTCVLFADGLRYDLGRRLQERLEQGGLRVRFGTRWAALPTVTATAKTAVAPLGDVFVGRSPGTDFAPVHRASGKAVDVRVLREVLKSDGVQVLDGDDPGFPEGAEPRGFVEVGQIDARGHQLQADLARQLKDEIEKLSGTVVALLDNGWKAVRVVTDHGWLLLPGGLPSVDLPKHLTESRWARAAVVRGAMPPGCVVVPWHWNPEEFIATPPGAACFNRDQEYAHGGVSLQECLTPWLVVERASAPPPRPSIISVGWRRLRCLVQCGGAFAGLRAEVRLGTPSGRAVVPEPKPVESDGVVSFPIPDDYEGQDLVVVLLDASGVVVAERPTKTGAAS